MNKERVRYNLILGPYEFIQDQWDFGKYHIPGGAVVTEDWLRQLATNSNFGKLKKSYLSQPVMDVPITKLYAKATGKPTP